MYIPEYNIPLKKVTTNFKFVVTLHFLKVIDMAINVHVCTSSLPSLPKEMHVPCPCIYIKLSYHVNKHINACISRTHRAWYYVMHDCVRMHECERNTTYMLPDMYTIICNISPMLQPTNTGTRLTLNRYAYACVCATYKTQEGDDTVCTPI